MPGSSSAGRDEALEMVFRIEEEIETILDVGPGAGQWFDLLKQWFPGARWGAIEIFEPYVERYGLSQKYDRGVMIADARELTWHAEKQEPGENVRLVPWDLAIFGDVIEHMSKEDAVRMVLEVIPWRHALISIPIGPCPQDGTEENPHEEHVAEWTTAEVLEAFPVVDPYFAYQYPPPHYGRGVFLLERPT